MRKIKSMNTLAPDVRKMTIVIPYINIILLKHCNTFCFSSFLICFAVDRTTSTTFSHIFLFQFESRRRDADCCFHQVHIQ